MKKQKTNNILKLAESLLDCCIMQDGVKKNIDIVKVHKTKIQIIKAV